MKMESKMENKMKSIQCKFKWKTNCIWLQSFRFEFSRSKSKWKRDFNEWRSLRTQSAHSNGMPSTASMAFMFRKQLFNSTEWQISFTYRIDVTCWRSSGKQQFIIHQRGWAWDGVLHTRGKMRHYKITTATQQHFTLMGRKSLKCNKPYAILRSHWGHSSQSAIRFEQKI